MYSKGLCICNSNIITEDKACLKYTPCSFIFLTNNSVFASYHIFNGNIFQVLGKWTEQQFTVMYCRFRTCRMNLLHMYDVLYQKILLNKICQNMTQRKKHSPSFLVMTIKCLSHRSV